MNNLEQKLKQKETDSQVTELALGCETYYIFGNTIWDPEPTEENISVGTYYCRSSHSNFWWNRKRLIDDCLTNKNDCRTNRCNEPLQKKVSDQTYDDVMKLYLVSYLRNGVKDYLNNRRDLAHCPLWGSVITYRDFAPRAHMGREEYACSEPMENDPLMKDIGDLIRKRKKEFPKSNSKEDSRAFAENLKEVLDKAYSCILFRLP